MFTHEILSNPDQSVPYCHCASIALAPDGSLFVVWYAYPEQETRDGTLVIARKPAGSERFEPPRRIIAEMSSSLGNPLLFCDPAGRTHLMFVALQGQFWDSAVASICHSDDVGKSWSPPQTLRLPAGMMIRHAPIARQNSGGWLLPAYDESSFQTVLISARSDAVEWTPHARFDGTQAIQGDIVRFSDSELVMMLRPHGENRTCLRAISDDDGRSWSNVLRTPLPNPLSGVAAFRLGDTLCTVYNHTTEQRRSPLSLSCSHDRGISWDPPVHIDESASEVSYPSFLVDGSGVAHGVYTYGRTRIRYVSFDRDWWMN